MTRDPRTTPQAGDVISRQIGAGLVELRVKEVVYAIRGDMYVDGRFFSRFTYQPADWQKWASEATVVKVGGEE